MAKWLGNCTLDREFDSGQFSFHVTTLGMLFTPMCSYYTQPAYTTSSRYGLYVCVMIAFAETMIVIDVVIALVLTRDRRYYYIRSVTERRLSDRRCLSADRCRSASVVVVVARFSDKWRSMPQISGPRVSVAGITS